MTHNGMRPAHPSEILREEYLEPLSMNVNALAKALHVPATRMNEIVREQRGISTDTALRLTHYFGTSERFWLNLQMEFDLRGAQMTKAAQVSSEVRPYAV